MCLTWLAVQLLALNVGAANKLQVDLTQPGLRARSEAPIPVNVRFQWDGTAILEGRLDVELHDGNRILGHYRSGDVALTSGEQKFNMLLPPCEAPIADSQVEVRLKFITTAGDVLDLDPTSLFMSTMSQRSLVMAWCNARTAAAAPDFEQTMMLDHFAPQANEPERRLSLTTIVRLAPEDLPLQPLSYTAFDTTVLTADAFSETTEGQLKSLARWVKGGGSVCVFATARLEPHQVAFLNELLESADDNSASPHPGPMTRSLPLARPSRASGFAQIPFAASQAAQVPRGEGETLSRSGIEQQPVTQSNVGTVHGDAENRGSSFPPFQADSNGNLVPGQKKISCVYSGMGRSVIVTGTVGTEIPLDSPDWRQAVAFLWKFRETRAQAIAETGHWEKSETNESGDVPPITIEQYAAHAQSWRTQYRPNGLVSSAAQRQMAETRMFQSINRAVMLTDAEKDKVKVAVSNYFDALQQSRTGPTSGGRSNVLAAYQAFDTNLMGILTADQYTKYQTMRAPGVPRGFVPMDLELIAKDLGLTADEKSKVKAAMDEWNATVNRALAFPRSDWQNEWQAAQQAFNLKLKEVVTAEQYAKFQAGYPSRYMVRPAQVPPPRVMQPFNNGIYSINPSYEVQPSMLVSQLMPSLLPKTVRLIPFPALMGILVLFLLAIGPGDYFMLGSLRRRRYTWLLFPALSFCFMLATVLMANHFLGARDQRRSLTIVDLDKDGTALRWNRYDLIFAAADKQAVTELKDALWVPLSSELMPGMPNPYIQSGMPPGTAPGMPAGTYARNGLRNPNQFRLYTYGGPTYGAMETGPAFYEGIVPTHFQTSQLIRQWQPRLNRVFSFEPPVVPLLRNWREVEAAWPDLPAIRGKLSARKRFEGDVCAISSAVPRTFHATVSQGLAPGGPGGMPPQGTVTPTHRVSIYDYSTMFDSDSSQILPPSILSELCLGGSSGLRAVVSQISPNGGGSSEDVPAMDTDAGDSALIIVTQSGDDIIVYRRFFHGS